MTISFPRVALFAALFCACMISVAPAADEGAGNWPQWRGPNRDNLSQDTGLLKKWPADGPPRLWEAKGLGNGFSSISVAAGKIFTMGDFNDGCYVIALDGNGAKTLWKVKVGAPGGGQGYPGPRSTPTFDGTNVYALGQFGDLVCVDAAGGAERWRKNLVKDFGGEMMSG